MESLVCVHCDEPIFAHENFERYANGPVAHSECFARRVIGSVAHIERRCSCYVPGAACTDPPEMTGRVAARAALKAFLAKDTVH
jgi:hypothetical protein